MSALEIREKLLAIAHAEINNANPHAYWIECLGQDPNRPARDGKPAKHYAWCGIFALWCMRRLQLCDWTWSIAPDKPGFLFRLQRTNAPEPGDIAYFDAPYQHHALVQRVEGDTVYIIQGNYGAPGHVAESTCSLASKHPAFFSIERLVADRLAYANTTGQ